MNTVLRTNNLSKKYGKTYVVDNVTMTIEKGDIYGLIGENGAGKSTIMKLICGLVNPTKGNVELFNNENPALERFRMGCLIDAPAFYPDLSARKNLEIYRRSYGITNAKCVTDVLQLMNLTNDQNKLVKKYSLGMKQRLAIGIALLGSPDFLILDEPMNGLDPTGIHEIRNLLEHLNKEKQITILISSHILGELSKISTKYGILKKGCLIDEISARELSAKCQHCLKIRVSDVSNASVVLEKELHTTNYEIIDTKTLRLFDYVDNPGLVNSTLVKNNIFVLESGISGETLEDYFNEKIGGVFQMLNMIRSDLYRCFHGRHFKWCLLFTFMWVIFCAFLQQGTISMREALSGTKITIDYWNSFWGYHPVMIPLLIFCCIECMTDFKQKTIKLYVAKGISRWSFLFSKIFMGWIAAFLFVVAALFAGIISDAIFYGGTPGSFLHIWFIAFLLEYWFLHATAATFIISIIFLMRGNMLCVIMNLLLLIYGYFILNKIELSLGYDGLITRLWLYSYIGSIEMGNFIEMLPQVLLLFVGYLVVFGAISSIMFHKIDIE